MKSHIEAEKNNDIKLVINSTIDSKTRKSQIKSVNYKYAPTLNILYREIQAAKPINCSCGGILLCTDEKCPQCGRSRQEILEEITNINNYNQKIKTLSITALISMPLGIIFAAMSIYGFYASEFETAIMSLIFATVLLILGILTLNKKLKNVIIEFLTEKTPLKNKKDFFKEKITKFFLPAIIIISTILIVLMSICTIIADPNSNTSAAAPSSNITKSECEFDFFTTNTVEISYTKEYSYFILNSKETEYNISNLEFISENPNVATFSYDSTALGNFIYYNIEPVSKGETYVYVKCNDCGAISQKLHVVVDLKESPTIPDVEKLTEPQTEESTETTIESTTESKTENHAEKPFEMPIENDIPANMKNALSSALSYLDAMPISYKTLIEQLEYEGYTNEEATYATDNCGADWNEQAVRTAREYLKGLSFTRYELIDQLVYEGFTYEQAEYAVDSVGY